MRPLFLLCAFATAGCAPALAVTATVAIPPAVATSAPKSPAPEGEQPERDPQARGAAALYASELPDDRDGSGLGPERASPEVCADPERLEGCPRGR